MENRLKHVLSSRQFDLGFIINIFKDVNAILDLLTKRDGRELLTHVCPGYVAGEMFWQESSRTFHRFAAAAVRLGMSTPPSERGVKKTRTVKGKKITKWELVFSSEMKDAYFEDEVRAWASYYDVLILRTAESGLVARAAEICDEFGYDVHFINAGDGRDGEHPTQTLLDLFTIINGLGLDIEHDFAKLKNYSIAFLNDLKNSRTIHSLAPACAELGMSIKLISDQNSGMPEEILEGLRKQNCNIEISDKLIPADIYYVTRRQNEYNGEGQILVVDQKVANDYGVKVVAHPFPRTKQGNELPIWKKNDSDSQMKSLDKDPRAVYFKQMAFGMPVSMALLKYLLNPYLDFKKLKEEKLVRGLMSQCISCNRVEYHELGWTERAPSCGYIQTLPHIICPSCRSR